MIVNDSNRQNFGDSLASLTTSLGQQVSKMEYKNVKQLNVKELDSMFSGSFISKKFITKTVADMLKIPREFEGDVKEEDIAREYEFDKIRKLSLTWSSLYGDSLVVAVTDGDVEAFEEPLRNGESLVRFIVLARNEYSPSSDVDDDIKSPNFGQPLYYDLKIGKGNRIHHTRCHRIRLGERRISDKSKYGVSDLQAPYNAIKIFESAVISIGDIIKDSNIKVIGMQELFQKLANGQCDLVATYGHMMKEQMSSSGLVMIDNQDTFSQVQASYSGLSEVVDKMLTVLSGALDRPITVLFGQSASGFASGEEDNNAYYETINGLQESRLRPLQEFLDSFFPELDNAIYKYPSIDSVNEKQSSEIMTAVTTAVSTLVLNDVIDDRQGIEELQKWGFFTGVKVDEKEDQTEEDESYSAFETYGGLV